MTSWRSELRHLAVIGLNLGARRCQPRRSPPSWTWNPDELNGRPEEVANVDPFLSNAARNMTRRRDLVDAGSIRGF
jgi:hypothetical protein